MTTAEVVFFPLDRQLDVKERNWSESIIREATWLSGKAGSYEEAEEILKRIGHIEMDDSTLWRHVKTRGEALREAEEKRKEKSIALPQVGEAPRQPSPQADRMGVGIDGAMVNIREEGWKEFKVGTVYEIAERANRDRITGEWIMTPCAVNNSYVAHLGDAQQFGPLLFSEAQAPGWEDARYTQVIGDGASWIWNLADLYFPSASEPLIGITALNICTMLPLFFSQPPPLLPTAGSIRPKPCSFRAKPKPSLMPSLSKLTHIPLSTTNP